MFRELHPRGEVAGAVVNLAFMFQVDSEIAFLEALHVSRAQMI